MDKTTERRIERARKARHDEDLRHEQSRALIAYQLLDAMRNTRVSLNDGFSWSLVLAKPTASRHVTSVADAHPDIVLEAAACPRCRPGDAFSMALIMLDLAAAEDNATVNDSSPHYARRTELLHKVAYAAAGVFDIADASAGDLQRAVELLKGSKIAKSAQAILVAREISV